MALFDRTSTIGFIGAGAVGGALGVCLSRAGYRVAAVGSRTFASAQRFAERIDGCRACHTAQEVADAAHLVVISTADDAIRSVADGVKWRAEQMVVHCSGATSLDVFRHPASQGTAVGALHPLQAFSSVENGVDSIPGTTFGIEGDTQVREALADMARDIGGKPVFLDAEDKALYHLTGVMMGNLLTCLAATAAQLWEQCGYSRAAGIEALVPMMRGVVNNLERSGVPGAVAGPYVRGDLGTIRKHVEALAARAPEVLPLYRELARAAVPFGVEKQALSTETAQQIEAIIEPVDD
jgi:predicted short-subunit dehydrogenase-like oxidoreductase (DUF2520 family)